MTDQTTWTGTTGTDWFDGGNWTNCVPSALINATIPNGVTNQPVIGSGAAATKALTIQGNAVLTQSGGTLAVGGDFSTAALNSFTASAGTTTFNAPGAQNIGAGTFNTVVLVGTTPKTATASMVVGGSVDLASGMLQLGSANLTLTGTASSLTGYNATHFVVTDGAGKVVINSVGTGGRASAFFPIGSSATSYTPATVSNAGTLDNLSANVQDGISRAGTPVTSHVVAKTWNISEATPGGSDATIKLQWNTVDEAASFDRTMSTVSHFQTNAAANQTGWDNGGFGPAQSEGAAMWSRARSGFTSFSPFGVEDLSRPLPVELTRFEAKRVQRDAELSWTTASERANKGWEVLVSTTAPGSAGREQWQVLGFVTGAGSTSARHEYGFVDRTAGKAGVRYYRLRQLDLDGTTSLSDVRTVTFDQETAVATLAAYPNPVAEGQSLQISLTAPVAGPVQLVLVDALGRTVLTQTLTVAAGTTASGLDLPRQLPAGTYVLRSLIGGQWLNVRVVKQ